jgi:glycosyltransferase involved in cell wall biosynthesis
MLVKASIVMPVFNRTEELRRALVSLAHQTLSDFECYVVDDASQVDVAAVVREFDSRFQYVRSPHNVGPSAARALGFERASGDFVLMLDSDNEFYPWCLERAAWYLDSCPEISGVSGLYVYPDGLRVRVHGKQRIITPASYALSGSSHHDMVGAVRAEVVTEWLGKRRDYYAAEFHQWLTYHMSHDHLVVDEPWGAYNEGDGPRVSQTRDERNFTDLRLFIEDHRQLLSTSPCHPLDEYLQAQWVTLRRAGRPELELVENWMSLRGLTRGAALRKRLQRVLSRTRRIEVL